MTNIFLLPALKRHCTTSVIGLASGQSRRAANFGRLRTLDPTGHWSRFFTAAAQDAYSSFAALKRRRPFAFARPDAYVWGRLGYPQPPGIGYGRCAHGRTEERIRS